MIYNTTLFTIYILLEWECMPDQVTVQARNKPNHNFVLLLQNELYFSHLYTAITNLPFLTILINILIAV